MSAMYVFFALLCMWLGIGTCCATFAKLTALRGGLVPQADGGEYYEKFQLDYGCEDDVRIAGSMRGLVKTGRLSSLSESDPFLRWLNEKLEKGPQLPAGRVKPFYAVDCGKKADLKRGDNPKIIIVHRKLEGNKVGVLKVPKGGVDVEVREVWQPWLKPRCDFVVRYIVPNRANIIELMEGRGRFRAELQVGKTLAGNKESKTVTARMIFKPTLLDRLRGKKDVVLQRQLDAGKIFGK